LLEDPELSEAFEFDHGRDIYGDVVVVAFVDEEVGTKHCSGFAILVPSVDLRDVQLLKASIMDDNTTVEITTVATRHGFRAHASNWIGVLEGVQRKVHATKLVKTFKTMITRLNKRSKSGSLKKVTIKFPEEISNEYFNPGAPEDVLVAMPLPYVFEHEVSGKTSKSKFKTTESMMLWRVFAVGSDTEIEEAAAASDDDVMNTIGDILGNI
jgi:hypothetical protein